MKRKELEELNLEKEVVDKIMSINGADIEASKAGISDLQAQVAERDKSLSELNEKIKQFDGTDIKLTELQKKVESYEAAETERVEKEKAAKVDATYKERFKSIAGDNKFKHSDIEKGRYEAFKAELAKEENKGKGDKDIFEAITKDLDCFVNPQQEKINIPSTGKTGTTYSKKQIESMTEKEINENWNDIEKSLQNITS